jgi:hypothetical protein
MLHQTPLQSVESLLMCMVPGMQLENLRGLSRFTNGHHQRTLRELIADSAAYAAWDSARRAGHLDRVESAVGSMLWCGLTVVSAHMHAQYRGQPESLLLVPGRTR